MRTSLLTVITLSSLISLISCSIDVQHPESESETVIKTSENLSHLKDGGSGYVFPKAIGYVNDFENILSESQEKELTKLIQKHESETTDQIVIVTLKGHEPYDNLYDYSLDLANYWGIGQKDLNNGVLIAVGKDIKQVQIQSGSGILDRLNESETQLIIDDTMIPEFRNNDFFLGLQKGVEALIVELKREK